MKDGRGKNLIFLISQPRAGSTLLQLMLSGHTDIATTSEPWIALHPLYALREGGLHAEFDSLQAGIALGEFLKQGGMDEAFYREQVGVFLSSLYGRAAAHQGKRLFLDKTPRYYYIIDELAEVFPEAKIILLLRNPLAVLSSILKTWVKDDTTALGYHNDDLILAPAKLVEGLKKHPQSCCSIKYEDLVLRPEEVLKEICSFAGIDYQASMLDYGDRKRADWKMGDPVGVHKSSRPRPGSVDSWKKGFASQRDRNLAASYLEELGSSLVTELGYDYDELRSVAKASGTGKADRFAPWKEATGNHNAYFYEIYLLNAQKMALLNSLSWRITAPLRSTIDFIRRLGRNRK